MNSRYGFVEFVKDMVLSVWYAVCIVASITWEFLWKIRILIAVLLAFPVLGIFIFVLIWFVGGMNSW